MKILLDENPHIRFKNLFDNNIHHVFTIRDMDWLGIKNGDLLKLMEENFFDILIAVDKNLPYQQNINNLPVTVIILNVKRNVLKRITALYPAVFKLISEPLPKKIVILNEF